jgi:hypothetical protein
MRNWVLGVGCHQQIEAWSETSRSSRTLGERMSVVATSEAVPSTNDRKMSDRFDTAGGVSEESVASEKAGRTGAGNGDRQRARRELVSSL